MNHDEITKIVAPNGYGVGVKDNPFLRQNIEWSRRKAFAAARAEITEKIEMLYEPRFITPFETSEFIESLITMVDARQILELGTCTGYTTLHMLRAVIGKGTVVSVDCRPAHDRKFFEPYELAGHFRHLEGWTPDCLSNLSGMVFDFVFVDSDHALEHSQKELAALWQITRPGTVFAFHDVPEWQSPTNQKPPPIRPWLEELVTQGTLKGAIFPTCEQLDCLDTWGPGYPKQCNPHLGVFIRT
jgi:predicted O-methyltransferase YrrM